MRALIEAVQNGGVFSYVVFAVAIVAMVVSTVAVRSAFSYQERRVAVGLGAAALFCGILVVITGAVGYAWSMSQAFSAVAAVDPSMRAPLLAQAISEAMNLIVFGAVCAILPCLLALVALGRVMFTPEKTRGRGETGEVRADRP